MLFGKYSGTEVKVAGEGLIVAREEKLRGTDRDQGRGDGCEGDRAQGQASERGRAAGQGKTADEAGDGTTTATVLAQAIVREGLKSVAAGMNPMDLKRGIDLAVNTAVAELERLSKSCTDSETIAQVGTISSNGDSAIGKTIAKAVGKMGKEGAITVEDGSGLENELEIIEGMKFDRGYLTRPAPV